MSLQIGQYIKYALGEENAPELYHRLGGRVAPVVQPEDEQTAMPYAWYYSDGISEETTKDGLMCDICRVQIEVVANTYPEMVEMAILTRKAMAEAREAWNKQEGTPFRVEDQTFSASAEEYDDAQQAYCRRLIYTIETYE